jgi:hypothetical protein
VAPQALREGHREQGYGGSRAHANAVLNDKRQRPEHVSSNKNSLVTRPVLIMWTAVPELVGLFLSTASQHPASHRLKTRNNQLQSSGQAGPV